MPILRVEGLCKSFGSRMILDHVDFELYENDSFVILGGSGTGKSVFIKCILGLITPDAGKIWIHGKDISQLSAREREKMSLSIGMLFQSGALFDSMSVLDNVAFGLIYGLGMPSKQAKEIALETLTSVDLDESVAHVFPAELSGGMQKRVALARALAINPSIFLFDEPTTGLDPIMSSTINQLIVRTTKKASALTITHDIKSMRVIGRRVGLLSKGTFVWAGTIDEIDEIDASEHPQVRQFLDS